MNPEQGQSKNIHTLESLIQKLKTRSHMTSGLMNSQHQTPKTVLSQHLQQQEMQRSQNAFSFRRQAYQQNFNAVRHQQMGLYLQNNTALTQALQQRMQHNP